MIRFVLVGSLVLFLVSCSGTSEETPKTNSNSTSKKASETPKNSGNKSKDAKPVKDKEKPRVTVGQKAPAFRLKDQNGKEHALEDLTKEGKVALVFYRSADW